MLPAAITTVPPVNTTTITAIRHQHPSGVCPYGFDDRTGHNSGTSSGSTSDDGPYVLPQLKDEASSAQDKSTHETIGTIAGLAITFSPVVLYVLAALLLGKRRK